MRRRLLLGFGLAALAVGLGVGLGALLWAGGGGSEQAGAATPAGHKTVGRGPTSAQVAAVLAARKKDPSNAHLYVLESRHGWVDRVGDRRWTLHLEQPRVLWFADRPVRASGTMPVAKLSQIWHDVFAGSSPNGALTAPDAPDGPRPTALVVSRPTVQGTTVSFAVKADRGMTAQGVAWLSGLTKSNSASTGGVSFFVDDTDIQLNVVTDDTLVWRADLSQCAGYGSWNAPYGIITYDYIDTGKCAFERTYARFDILRNGTKVGTVDFEGSNGGDISCTNSLGCYATWRDDSGWWYSVDANY